MVHVIAHRGLWHRPEEQNQLVAFQRAFDKGLGVELDVRDHNGMLVVSHDPAVPDALKPPVWFFDEVLKVLGNRDNILAVNVKSCGLAPWFKDLKAPRNWFFFDLPLPEEAEYSKRRLPNYRVNRPWSPWLVISNEILGDKTETQWLHLRQQTMADIYLITDHPQEAVEYFK